MLYKTEVFLKDMDRWERGYVLTNDTTYLNVLNNVVDSIYPSLYVLEKLLYNNPVQRKNIISLKNCIALRINYSQDNIDYIDSTHSSKASPYYYEGRRYMVKANQIMREMHNTENAILSERSKRQQFYEKLTTNTLKSLLFIFCIVTMALFVLLMKVMRSGMLYQEELHAKVIDLKRSHVELQDIAYAISHDLQEPLRKIQVFSNMLLFRNSAGKDDDTKSTLQRINASANRMQLLIADLVSLTNLTKTDENKSPADLTRIVDYVLIDINDKIKEKQAIFKVQPLPLINGYEAQLKILFRALFDNALKFTREGTTPIVTVACYTVVGNKIKDINPAMRKLQFHCIEVSDNGIGFDNKYITNIFRIFRRLHTEQSQYEGKGIGLAICQRIISNHEGFIVADGKPQEGATFMLYFPVL
jgi:signal transduction histidine kinase